jgi:ABC-2 type transport system ATP-binding protein
LVGGQPYQHVRRPLRRVGALLDAAALQPSRTARNHLLWIARSQKLPAGRVDQVIELVGLASAARRKAGGFSLGMRQRLGTAAAMLGDPAVVILDEPFNGMDPEGIIWIRGFLRSLAADGRAVLVSSHLMGELQGMADQVVVVGRGRVLADAPVDELIARGSGEQVLLLTPAPADATTALQRAGATTTVTDRNTLAVAGIGAQRVVEVLSQAGVAFSELATQRATLEDVYLQLTGGETEYRGGAGWEAGR